MEEVLFADVTGGSALRDLVAYAKRFGVELALARVHSQTEQVLRFSEALDEIGDHRVHDTVRAAVDAASSALAKPDVES